MKYYYQFPFGQPLQKVAQKDRTPKKAFVLGVYASAVHARWIDADGKQKASALAVASEPEIFWHGENAEEIISAIPIPAEAGKLVFPGNKNMNGPSGKALDELFLAPLGLDRSNTWLCDLLPYSRVNPSQRKAIDNKYEPIREKFNLPKASIPDFDKDELRSEKRRDEILTELKDSEAKTLILLGDLPIKHFVNHYDKRFSKLADFGTDSESYGTSRRISIDGKEYDVIALCHPRQAARLGSSSMKWGELHDGWVKTTLKKIGQ